MVRPLISDSAASTGEDWKVNAYSNATKVMKRVAKAKVASSDPGLFAESDGIPAFARASWTTAFLPTLYNNMFCSEKPFQDFQKGEQILKRLQSIVDLVYPDSGYEVNWGDGICQTVCLENLSWRIDTEACMWA